MYLTSISISYLFLAAAIIALGFLFYFKILMSKTGLGKEGREKILGNMKDPDSWRDRNNKMSYISFFWTIASLAAFIYFKFFHNVGLISIFYVIGYLILVVASIFLLGITKKTTA